VKADRFTKLLLALLALAASQTTGEAQTLTVLYNFGVNAGDPTFPVNVGWIAEGKDGNIYTTSQQGGTLGRGTIFKFTPDGKLTVLYNFDNTHGSGPQSGLTLGSEGNFYGTAYGGGKYGIGTIFKISPTGKFTHLHDFNGTDGSYPISPPVQGKDGNLYGVASYIGNYQLGCIYKITPNGGFTPLFKFTGPNMATYGAYAISLTPASDGNFYGTTIKGGTGFGTAYRVTPAGAVTVLHVFDNVHGATSCSIMQASDGNLYGTCYAGGPSNYGLVYKMKLNGELTVLHNFVGTDGASPWAGVIEAKDGYLYGTTRYGGTGSRGVIYRMKPDGTDFAVVYNRNLNMTEGLYCMQPGIQHSNGRFYNCVWQGGSKSAGIFYSLDMRTFSVSPLFGKVGTAVTLNGFGFTGATSVTFNGTAAAFKVVSDTSITCTVPAGATVGTVKVVTPKGTMTSKTVFQAPT
jgi:uncharacterized repeat protein (TIGR03803 family)